MTVQSCIYEGRVRHRRFGSPGHEFGYALFMMYVDLEELSALFAERWLWSATRPNVAWFRRRDHLGPADRPLTEVLRDLICARTGHRPTGPIRLLTHFRYFGYVINPISLYYCFGNDERLQFVVVEVTNTPWGERHCYLLDVRGQSGSTLQAAAAKQLHVSPFQDMEADYQFQLTCPGDSLAVHIQRHARRDEPMQVSFDATLTLQQRELSGRQLARVLSRYPAMTAQVFVGIYWQALQLWWKGAPFFSHPPGTRQEATCPSTPSKALSA